MKKIAVSSLVSLFVLSCSVSAPNNSTQDGRMQYAPTNHYSPIKEDFTALAKKYNFAELEKEYKSFSTKALAETYVKKMFNKFLIVTPNSVQVIRQVEFSRYLKNNGDTSYETSLKNIFTDTPVLYSSLTGMAAVQSKMTSESGTFGFYILGVSPNQTVPGALPATNITETSFTANWSAVTGATSYILIVDGVEITGITGTNRSVTGLQFGTSHTYKVKAIVSGVTGNESNQVSVITLLPAPVASAATDIIATSFKANWSTVANATGYTLYVSDGTITSTYSIPNPAITSHILTNLKFNKSYSHYVKSINALAESTSSNIVNVTTRSDSIAFYSNRDGNNEIYVMNADGTNQTRLTNNSASDAGASFSPDGSKIVFFSDRDGNNEIYVMNADGTNQTRLTNNSANDPYPFFSPDGSKIVFYSNRDGNYQIYIMNVDGTNQTRLTNNSANEGIPFFSPDGSKIAFYSNRDGNNEIYIMNSDGTNQTRLTNNTASDSAASFSPDGSKIVFQSNRDGNGEIYVMNTDGTNQIRLTNNSAHESIPFFSPDGSKIAFQSNRDGNDQVYVMNTDGTNQTRLSDNSANNRYPIWGYLKTPLPVSFSPTSVTSDSFTANWGAMTGATGYKLFVDGIQVGGTLSSGTTSYAITALTPGTSHTYYVQAINAGGTTSPSNTVSVTLLPPIVSTGLVLNLDAGNPASYSGTGTTWTDLSGNNHNGILTNGPLFNSANGGSLFFDGIDDYINTPNFMGNINTFSVSHWVYLSGNQTMRTIFCNYGNLNNGWVTGISDNNSNVIKFYLGSTVHLYSNTVLSNFTWYHVTVTYNNGNPKIYINGVLDNSSSDTITFASSYNGNDIGRLGGNSQFFYGKISNLQVYNKALSSTEVTQNYNATKSRFGL